MSEIQIERNEYGQWEVYVDGSPKGEFATKAEAETFAAARAKLTPEDAAIYHGSLAGE